MSRFYGSLEMSVYVRSKDVLAVSDARGEKSFMSATDREMIKKLQRVIGSNNAKKSALTPSRSLSWTS